MEIKTNALRKALKSRQGIADFFGCDYQAVYQWGEFIPKVRAYELKDRRPDLFDDIKQGKYA